MGAKGHFKSHCKHGHAMEGENLHIDRSGKRSCKACTSAAKKKWAENNRERNLEKHRLRAAKWRRDNPEKARLSKLNFQLSAKAKQNAVKRSVEWRRNNPEKFKEQRRKYYERNKDKLLAYWRELRNLHREEDNAKRRERHRRDNPGGQIRKLARDVSAGRIDSDAAAARIREIFAGIDGRSKDQA